MNGSRLAVVLLSALLVSATVEAQIPAPTIEQAVRMCLTPCARGIRAAPAFTTVTYELTITNNWEDNALTFDIVEDMPPSAVDFRVTSRGYQTPCGAPGNPTCVIIPAPGGANGTGQFQINDLTVQRMGRLGSSVTVVFEVDYSCPPLTNGAIVANQAFLTTPATPAVCNPCRSNDPTTPAPNDPTTFRTVCLAPPPYSATKTASVSEWRPTDSPVIDYVITIRNESATDTIPGSSWLISDNLPVLFNGFPAFDLMATCPPVVVCNPPFPITVDAANCDLTSPFFQVTDLPDLAPGGTVTLSFPVTMSQGLPDGFDFCNKAIVGQWSGSSVPANACTEVIQTLPADFRESVKTVSPDPASAGGALAYTITVRNTGASPATGTILTDVLPACIDDSGFDAADVVVSAPGPASPITYDRPTRTLTVPLGAFPAGSTRTVTLNGLLAGPATALCCNQAFIGADGIPLPGQPTGTPTVLGAATCVEIQSVQGPNFRDSIKSVSPSPAVTGQSVTYAMTITNSGVGAASAVVVTDDLPACVDAAGFNPLTDVVVTPGPATVNYNASTRRLTIDIPSLAPATTRSITVNGLVAGAPTASCCNQAFVTSAEVPAPGHPTGTAGSAGSQSCVAINTVGVGCDLNRAALSPTAPLAPVYTNDCGGGDLRLDPAGQIVDVVTDQVVDTLASAPGQELTLYQIDCSCANPIRLVKDAGPPASVKLKF